MARRVGTAPVVARYLGTTPIKRRYVGGQLTWESSALATPQPPTNVRVTAGATSALLEWDPPASGPAPTGYRNGRGGTDSFGGGPWETVDGPAVRSREFLYLVPGQTYPLTVRTVVGAAESTPVTLSVTPGGGGSSALSGLPKQGVSPGYTVLEYAPADQDAELAKTVEMAAGKPLIYRFDCNPGNQSLVDRLFPKILARGWEPLPILWGSEGSPPAAGTFARDMAIKFGSSVRLWEIVNEPDMRSGAWQPDVYADFLKAASIAIKGVNSDAKVFGPAIFNGKNVPALQPDKWAHALGQRAAGHFDLFSVHPYGPANMWLPNENRWSQDADWPIWNWTYPTLYGRRTFYAGKTIREILDSYGLQHVPLCATENGGTVRDNTAQEVAGFVNQNFDAVRDGLLAFHCLFCVQNRSRLDMDQFGAWPAQLSTGKQPAFGVFQSRAVPNVTAAVPGTSTITVTP